MRRTAVLLMALFLVNLPFVNQSLADRQVTREGREVSARVLDSRQVGSGRFLDFRFPDSIDAEGTRYSVRVDAGTYAAARRSGTLPVRVVPDRPSRYRAAGQVGSSLFVAVALGADALFLLAAAVWWRRRRWRLFRVLEVGAESVTLTRDGLTVTALAPERWLLRTRAGQRVAGTLHLTADQDVVPQEPSGLGGEPFEERPGSSYVVRGRVLDVSPGVVRLEAAEGLVVAVETGPHRNRADVRQNAAASGVLHLTPR